LDIAKHLFHAHEADATGRAVFSRRLTRGKLLDFFASYPRCVVALEACGGAQHWARELQSMGHEVQLIPPAYVKPYVKRHKNDAVDAEATGGKQKLGAISKMGERTLRRLLIIGSSTVVLHPAVQLHVRIVQVPSPLAKTPHARGTLAAYVAGEQGPVPVPPLPLRLVADADAALEEQVLHVPQRERKAHLHQHHETDHLGRRVEPQKRTGQLGSGRAGHPCPLPADPYPATLIL
jgi:hypothetical protein